MKVEIHKQDLIGPASTVQKATSGRILLPILEGIYFKAEDNQITFMGIDGEVPIQSMIVAKVIEEEEIVLGFRLFGDIIRRLPSTTIYLTSTERNLNTRCRQSESDIMGQSTQEFPQMPEINDPVKTQPARESLVNPLRPISFAVSLDDPRMALTGVLLDYKPGKVNFVTPNGYRMALDELEIRSDAETQTIVPARACTEIIWLLDGPLDTVLIELADNYIKINLESTIFVLKFINGEFFQHQGLVRNDHKINIKLKCQNFVQGLERTNPLAKEERSGSIRLDIPANKILIESHSDTEDIHELIPCTTEGEGLKIAFNSEYLLERVKATQEEEIICRSIDSVNPYIIESDEKSGYTHLALPVRSAGQ